MRRVGGLFERVVSYDYLELAARRAQRGKRYRPDVLRFNRRREDHLHRLRRRLARGDWTPEGHRHFPIYEPKARWISAAPYADRVVHHALCNVIEPVLDRRLIDDCFANRRGKGIHRAVLRYQALARRWPYALRLDIRQYFPSIDHLILKQQLRRVFRERRLLELIDRIVDHGRVPRPYCAYFDGDDLFTPFERSKGLPIGNLTSQLWANSYLSELDHWVKQRLGVRGYVRFVDDSVLLASDKSILRRWLDEVSARLARLRLALHPRKCVIRRTDEGLPFLGYVVWPDRIRVRGATVRRFRRRMRVSREEEPTRRVLRVAAWSGHARLAGQWRQTSRLR